MLFKVPDLIKKGLKTFYTHGWRLQVFKNVAYQKNETLSHCCLNSGTTSPTLDTAGAQHMQCLHGLPRQIDSGGRFSTGQLGIGSLASEG